MSTLQRSLEEARNDAFETFAFEHQFRSALAELWRPAPEVAAEHGLPEAPAGSYSLPEISFDLADIDPTTWSIAFTATFRKAVAAVDKKLQGRILAALADLSETPTLAHGDTKRPLVGEYKGLWRYRLGDYRLLYEPREAKRLVVLVDFSPRGSAYEP